jgi:DnaK suppressor protein
MRAKDEKALELERAKLKEEYEQTQAEIERLRESLKVEVDPSADEGDPDLYEREKNLALLQTLGHRLQSLEWALHLVDRGSYGICERCGQRIDPARLKILPETTLCVKCKGDLERLAKHRMPSARF